MNQVSKHQIFRGSDAGSILATQDSPGVVARLPLIWVIANVTCGSVID
jgi:hypothetical protein